MNAMIWPCGRPASLMRSAALLSSRNLSTCCATCAAVRRPSGGAWPRPAGAAALTEAAPRAGALRGVGGVRVEPAVHLLVGEPPGRRLEVHRHEDRPADEHRAAGDLALDALEIRRQLVLRRAEPRGPAPAPRAGRCVRPRPAPPALRGSRD